MPELTEALSALFHQPVLSLRQLPSLRNLLFRVRLAESSWVVKLTEGETPEFPLLSLRPLPLTVYPERCYLTYEGKTWLACAYSCLEGREIPPTPGGFALLGRAIGEMHCVWQDCERPVWLPDTSVETLITAPLAALSDFVSPQTRQYAQAVGEILSEYRDPALLGICHGDAHDCNALRQANGQAAFFDFEDACWCWRAYDLATCIWGSLRFGSTQRLWNAFLSAYDTVHPLTDLEEALIPYLIFARQLWWLGLNAKNWDTWAHLMREPDFFPTQLELLNQIAQYACDL